MFTYLDDGLNEYNVFAEDDDSSSSYPRLFTMFTCLDDGFNECNAFEEVDSSSSQSVSSPESGDDSDSNHSISEKSNVVTPYVRLFLYKVQYSSSLRHLENDVTSITAARRRSWRSFRRSLPANLLIAPEDSDQDADGESDDAGSDDEYVPPPDLDLRTTTQSLKRRRSVSVSQCTETSTSTRSSLPSNASSHSTAKRIRVAPPSRNQQASQATSQIITRVVNNNLIESTNFICPECGWRQINKRVPDFKRHLKTHLRAKDDDHSSGYWCKGVRVEDARYYNIQPDATAYRFQEHERIGGCMRTFSRRDALKRHLDNANISCVAEFFH